MVKNFFENGSISPSKEKFTQAWIRIINNNQKEKALTVCKNNSIIKSEESPL